MNDKTNFDKMLNLIWDMQTPNITVECLSERLHYDGFATTHHIIVADGKDKVLDFCFVEGRNTDNNYLYYVKSVDITFEEALMRYSKEVMRGQGKLTLYGC